MKTPPRPQTAGVALVIVLSFLVLISVIIIGFFASVSTELVASRTVATSANVHQLADSAVNVVMAQLVDATKGSNSGEILSWASQPGLIRTFDATGKPRDFFKLYSSDKMTVKGSDFSTTPDLPPTDWKSAVNTDLYTDLNAPAADTSGALVYPIVDPNAESQVNGQVLLKVDGFSITSRPGYDSTKAESTINNRAPMPVKWLYLLRDGSLQSASLVNGSLTVQNATTTNPIVGRVAFWSDDETAKVNINTASEGVYWDMPRMFSRQDFGQPNSGIYGLSFSQPVQREYQRYPGHPATTSLSPIFGWRLPVPSPYPANPQSTDASALDPYYDLTPRVGLPGDGSGSGGGGGGSLGGTKKVGSNAAVLTTDTDRLYASIDELMFTPTMAGKTRSPNTSAGAATPNVITKQVLARARFFITAHSSAPETTLYNTPRLAVWPVAVSEGQRNAFDSLLAFCSTIGKKEYYFTRNPITGARSGTEDYSPRNKQLYEYLQAVTKTKVPGFGGDFLTKYPVGQQAGVTERDQILTYIYDYIRCTNLQDRSSAAVTYTPYFDAVGSGEVVPIRIGQTQGFGRFYSITSANLQFYTTAAGKMRANFFFSFVTPMQGLACMRNNMKYKVVSGLDGLKANGKSLNFKPGGTNYIERSDLWQFHGRGVGGTESAWQGLKNKPFNDADAGRDARGTYPFFSAQDVEISGTEFDFTADKEILVEIREANSDALVQTFHFSFPPGRFRVPTGNATASFGSRTGRDYAGQIALSDTLVSLQVAGVNGNDPAKAEDAAAGDNRLVASLIDVPAKRFRADNEYKTTGVQWAHCQVMSTGTEMQGATYGKLAPVPSYRQTNHRRQPDVPSRASNGVFRSSASGGGPGEWDTGLGDQKDGAYINKPDEGDTDDGGRLPYMLGFNQGREGATNTYFSPNRQIPSPLMLGSIPTGVQRALPWQTLLFHPRPEDPQHPGHLSPKDHLIADLFWMPVVEPYAISQPFATNGKINLNYQIMPFTYINRSTGLHAVMKSTRFAAMALTDAELYKPLDVSGRHPTCPDRRQPIDMKETLKAFDTKFAGTDNSSNIFKSATQICEMNLVPPGETNASMADFWKTRFAFTGNNLREKPYVDLYSRLTTKSNAYTVHVRVQALKKAPGSAPDQWVPARDKVVGEYRGSVLLERYIDLNDPALPDFAAKFATNPSDSSLNIDQYYRMRVVSKKRFAP